VRLSPGALGEKERANERVIAPNDAPTSVSPPKGPGGSSAETQAFIEGTF